MGSWPERLVLATGNPDKREEWQALLPTVGVEPVVVPLADVDETADTYQGNARLKVLAAVAETGLPAIGDDAGVEVAALDGVPGLYTKRWAMNLGGWEAARAYLLEHARDSAAVYFCAVAVAWPDGRLVDVMGEVQVRIAPGDRPGSGLEPVLWPVGKHQPLAALHGDPVHHRQQALAQLRAILG